MQTPFPNSSDFKAKARKALRPNLNTAVMLMFLASLPSLISSTVNTMATQSYRTELYRLVVSVYTDVTMTADTLLDKMTALGQSALADPAVLGSAVFSIIVFLLTPVLSLGLVACLMRMLRGELVATRDLLCRKSCFFKAIGLLLYTGIRLFLWMLPGIVLTVVSVPVLNLTKNLTLFNVMYFGGIILILVLGLRAAMHYSQAEMLLADHPGARIRDCVHDSFVMMHHRKKYLFLLYISFAGWYLLIYLVENLASGMNDVLYLLIQMIANLALSLYMNTSLTAFYIHYEQQPDAM